MVFTSIFTLENLLKGQQLFLPSFIALPAAPSLSNYINISYFLKSCNVLYNMQPSQEQCKKVLGQLVEKKSPMFRELSMHF